MLLVETVRHIGLCKRGGARRHPSRQERHVVGWRARLAVIGPCSRQNALTLDQAVIMGLIGIGPVAGFLEGFHRAGMKGQHPFHGLALHAETKRPGGAILEGFVAVDHGLGDSVNLVIRFRSVSDEIRIGVAAHFDRLFRRDRGAAGRDQFREERADLLHTRPTGIVVVGQRRPDDAARRTFEFARGSRYGRGKAGVGIVVDDAFPHGAVARKFDDLDVLWVRPANARTARAFWLSAGDPTTKPTRLPRNSLTCVTPVSRATPNDCPLQSVEERMICSGCGPHSFAPNSNTPSCAKYAPDPIAETVARPARTGARRATSLPAGRTRTSVPYLSFIILPTATEMLKPAVPVS